MDSSVKFADPARTTILESSVENCTGAFGSFDRDLGQQPSGDQNATWFFDLCGDLGLSRHLVVERRELQTGVGGLDQDAAQDGQGRSLRKELDGERDGFTEHIPIGLELHEVTSVDRREMDRDKS